MPPTAKQVYKYAKIVRQPTFSDEETLAKIKAMDSFGRTHLGDLGHQAANLANPVWLAICVSGVISHLLDIATTGAKNEGVLTMETLSNRTRLVAITHLGLLVPRLELDLQINQKQVDDLIARVPRILEIYEKAIQSQDPPSWGGVAALRFPLLLLVGHLAHPETMTIIDEHLTLLQSKVNTMTWLVFTPFFQERDLLDRKFVFQIHTGGNILRSYDEFNINITSGIIDEAISRFGVFGMVHRSIVLCKASRPNDQELILGTRVLVLNLLEDQRFHEPFILRKRVHRILANRFWECTRKRAILQNDTLIKETYDLARAFERILQYLTTDQLRAVMIQDLVMGHDFLPLIARVLLRFDEGASSVKTIRALMDAVIAHCQEPQSRFHSLLQRDWLYGSYCFHTYFSPGDIPVRLAPGNPFRPTESIQIWNEFGARLGFHPPNSSSCNLVSDEDGEPFRTGCS